MDIIEIKEYDIPMAQSRSCPAPVRAQNPRGGSAANKLIIEYANSMRTGAHGAVHSDAAAATINVCSVRAVLSKTAGASTLRGRIPKGGEMYFVISYWVMRECTL